MPILKVGIQGAGYSAGNSGPAPKTYYYTAYDGAGSLFNCGQDASLDDLHDGLAVFTVDLWVYVPDEQITGPGALTSKFNVDLT